MESSWKVATEIPTPTTTTLSSLQTQEPAATKVMEAIEAMVDIEGDNLEKLLLNCLAQHPPFIPYDLFCCIINGDI